MSHPYQYEKAVELRFYEGPLDGLIVEARKAPEKLRAEPGTALITEAPADAFGPEIYERRSSSVPPVHYVWLGYGAAA
jgi:hypothetical protein